MKDFLKYMLATIAGIIVVALIISVFSLLTFVGIASMDSSASPVLDNSVLVIKLDGTISERAQENPFAQFLGDEAQESGLDDLLTSIKCAKENDKIKGIYLEGGALSGATPATLEELRNALLDFKTSGKFIMAYADNYTQGTYYLCSTADSLVINPQGMLEWKGMASQTIYYKNLLEKVGVSMQVFKVGTYKSAVEPYLLDDMSDANREQITTFESEIWNKMLKDVSKSRNMKAEELNALTDSALMFKSAKFYKKNNLVDKIAYTDAVPQILANMMECDKDDYNTTNVADVTALAQSKPKSTSGNLIAVYYAEGEIVQEESASMLAQGASIVGPKVVEDLKELAEDEDVKAVVLRVNSPGGSAYASEQIWNQVMNIKANKPIIVSMGGYAASGGYYISCAADWIVAEPTTLTGSIGIFGMFPEASELINDKLGLNFVTVKTNEFADFGDLSRKVSDNEATALQGYINRGYELFTKRCADGRHVSQDSIKAIAEGRVWTGVHAKKIGLVDQLGSLEDAIEVAKKKAKIDDYTVKSYPAKQSVFDQLMNQVKGNSYADAKLKESLGEFYGVFNSVTNMARKDHIQAAMPYYLKFNL